MRKDMKHGRPGSGRPGPALANGFGIIASVDANSQTGVTIAADLTRVCSLAYVDHVQLNYRWNFIETAPGVFDFSQIRADLATVAAARKKAIITIACIGVALPSWYFDDSAVIKLRTSGGTDYPCYWDLRHQQRIFALEDALAAEFQDDRRIEGWKPFGYSNGSDEPNFMGQDGADATLKGYFTSGLDVNGHAFSAQPYNGNRPAHSATTPYVAWVYARVARFATTLGKYHAVFLTEHFTFNSNADELTLDQMLRDLGRAIGAVIGNTGGNQNDKADARQYFKEDRLAGAFRCGWFGTTSIGATADAWWTFVYGALGDTHVATDAHASPVYAPHGYCSYLTFNANALPNDGSASDRAPMAIYARARLDRI